MLTRWVKTIVLSFMVSAYCQAAAAGGKDLETIAPEEAGWSTEKLEAAAGYAEEIGYTAIVMAHQGKVFFEWGEVKKNYKCHSIRKPFLSALYGIYVANKTIDLDMTLADLDIDDIEPALTPDEKRATIRQVLQGRSGVYHPAAAETDGMAKERPERGSHEPGTFFYYNNWDFNAAGTIFKKLTGADVFGAFERMIAKPIGMQDFKASNCAYQYDKEKSLHPSYMFRMSARDMARFGILFQNGGVWEGKPVIPKDWVTESTTTYSAVDTTLGAGFGYMWGRILEGGVLEKLVGGTGLFFSGIGVHHLVILEEPGLVLVLRFDTDGDWTAPPPGAGGKLYEMIRTARIGADG